MSNDYDYDDEVPRRRPQPAPEPVVTPADEQAEEAAEQDAENRRYITVAFRGDPMRVIPGGAWPLSGIRAMNAGDYDTALPKILHPDDAAYIIDTDPSLDEFSEFMQDVSRLAEPGKARGPRASSRSTRRR